MDQQTRQIDESGTNHRFFAAMFERMGRARAMRRTLDPLRAESAGRATGVVLEVGAGTGLNFAFYEPSHVEHVDAVEPDSAMLVHAYGRLETARVPISITRAAVESLPFADASYDSAVATLVFCSVTDPLAGMRELYRVLKPGGTLYLVEHVRSAQPIGVRIQDALVPFTTRLSGNCHWNRDTLATVRAAGFKVVEQRRLDNLLHPFIVVRATHPA